MSTAVRALAVVDVGAIQRNCERLRDGLTGAAELCAVVKADGYGHGAVESARAAIAGGATRLAVATATEAAELRPHFPEVPILVMGALTPGELETALEAGAELAVWREGFRALVAERAAAAGSRPRIHLKLDSGMGRLGTPDEQEIAALATATAGDGRLELAALWTHFATADEPDAGFLREQLERFTGVAERLRASHPDLSLHAANSAATLREPASHLDMVRCGVAIYGLDPFGADPAAHGLEPALELRSYVADVKRFPAGASAGYGRTWRATAETDVGILPIGYGDGVRRGLGNSADVLVGGARRPIVGTVSMDNITVDLGSHAAVEPGAEAVLIGARDGERILVEELAKTLGTINYEVTCGISARVPREHRG